jgi:hydroxypyruvate isomerase
MSQEFPLAVCAEMVFLDLPFEERVHRIDELGFAVEIWFLQGKDIKALRAMGATFSSMAGYLHGNLVEPDAANTFLKTAEQTLDVAHELGCPRLVVHPAELVEGKAAKPMFRVSGELWLTARRTLKRLAELGERAGVVYCLENLNTVVDHPGVPLARAKDTLALVEAVDSPHVRMMLDLYHAQIGEGNLVALIERAVRCRWPTSPAAVSRGRARSTIRPSPAGSSASATPGRSGSRRTPQATMCGRSKGSALPSRTSRLATRVL